MNGSNTVWYQDERTDDGQILSSRVRLARNVKKYPFSKKLSAEDARRMVQETTDAINNERQAVNRLFHPPIDISSISETERKVFLEKHIVSPEFLKDEKPRGLLLTSDQNVSVMVNEEDHIRIQTVTAGDGMDESFITANRIDDLIEESVEYAFHKDYGYLTACPTNAGTGLRASYMIHLPFLDKANQLKNLLPALGKFGITLRGIYGEGTESMGGIYQISNQITLGKSEADIIQGLRNVTKNVIERETGVRDKMVAEHRLEIENNVYRAYGILAYSRKTTAKEAMDLLSEVRMGYLSGLLEMPKPLKYIYQIMMEIQPGHLQRMAGEELTEPEQNAARAEYLRGLFN